MNNEDYYLALGDSEILLNPKEFKVKDGRKLKELIDNVSANHSPYKRFPRRPLENTAAYLKRFGEHYGLETVRNEDESDDKYLSRVSKDTFQDDELQKTLDILKAIAAYVKQEHKVTSEGFEETGLDDIENFISKVFRLCKIARN